MFSRARYIIPKACFEIANFHSSKIFQKGLRDYRIEELKRNEKEIVKSFLKETFMKDEPMFQSLNLNEVENSQEFNSLVFGPVDDSQLSLAAIMRQNNKIVGISVNRISYVNDKIEPNNFADQRVKDLKDMYNFMENEFNFYHHFKVDYVWNVDMLAVRKKFQNKGIAIALFKASLCHAHMQGFSVARVLTTGEYSAKVCKKMGFKEYLTVTYNDYKNEKGEYIFKDKIPPPHVAFRTFGRKI